MGQSAVVIGGSMAGLLATRALASEMDHVVLVERDAFPDQPTFRAGVPQSRHVHVLLERGRRVLDGLFPGFSTELIGAGATPVAFSREGLWLTPVGWSRRFRRGPTFLCASRELVEWTVRQRVAALPNVEFRQRCDAIGLAAGADGGRVVGVRLQDRPVEGQTRPEPSTLPADLIVDASGRDSHASQWLESLGYDKPEETRINSFLGYASRCYQQPKDFDADWKMLFLQPATTGNMRGAVLLPIEGGRWLVTLGGVGGDYPPTDEEGFLDFCHSLDSTILYEAVQAASPLSPIYGYRRTENLRRHFERLARWPERFVVVGDAACAFNPIYGQGMSVAAIEASVLIDGLRAQRLSRPDGDLTGFARQFQARLARAQDDAWLLATNEDMRHPATEGARPSLATRLLYHYFDRVAKVATADSVVNFAFANVVHLLAPPKTLFSPPVLTRVLRGSRPALAAPPTKWRPGAERSVAGGQETKST